MKRSHIAAVFKKDGLELIRDKRTWFVNIVLPVLLYPILLLVGIQIYQITQPGPDDIPKIGIHNCPNSLQDYLRIAPLKKLSAKDLAMGKEQEIQKQLLLHEMDKQSTKTFDAYILSKESTVEPKYKHLQPTEKGVDNQLLSDALNEMRALNFSAAIICTQDNSEPKNWIVHVVADNAHRDYLQCSGIISKAVKRFSDELLDKRIGKFELSENFAQPISQTKHSLASTSETVKTHFLSGFLPVLLVLMAISGAYHPALDLIAGERERGTLETLLSWPSDRESIFFGKLLVVVCAALIMVVLNLLSLGITAGIGASQMADKFQNLGSLTSIGFD
ncbi:MAG: ABC transporter permease subunit, partial [Planctomycetes bacterium]|nr:ABC transporter permease subunit [Planctomycetota bacterium]